MLRKGGGRAPPAPGRRELGGERGSRTAARKPCQTAVLAAASRLLRTVRPPSASRHAGTGGRACRDAGTACGAACSHEAHGAVRAVPIGANRNQVSINAPPGPGACLLPAGWGGGRRGCAHPVRARVHQASKRGARVWRPWSHRQCLLRHPRCHTARALSSLLAAASRTPAHGWPEALRRRRPRGEPARAPGERSAVPTPPGSRSRTGCSTSSRRTSRIATSTSNCTSRGIDVLPATDFALRLRQGDLDPAA